MTNIEKKSLKFKRDFPVIPPKTTSKTHFNSSFELSLKTAENLSKSEMRVHIEPLRALVLIAFEKNAPCTRFAKTALKSLQKVV